MPPVPCVVFSAVLVHDTSLLLGELWSSSWALRYIVECLEPVSVGRLFCCMLHYFMPFHHKIIINCHMPTLNVFTVLNPPFYCSPPLMWMKLGNKTVFEIPQTLSRDRPSGRASGMPQNLSPLVPWLPNLRYYGNAQPVPKSFFSLFFP